MNKQLEEGKRLAEAPDSTGAVKINLNEFSTTDLSLKLYAHIEKLEALQNLAQDIVTHPCWEVNSEIPKSLKARRDLYAEAWNALKGES